jgi:ATP-binding cassette subfamily C protein CydCD
MTKPPWPVAVAANHRPVCPGRGQRLALARILLADFPVVILDEPAEHLDDDTAAELTRDLLEATTGRTILLITHRPVGFAEVDQIVSVEGSDRPLMAELLAVTAG